MKTFDDWYMRLQEIASQHGESVADVDAWREDAIAGRSPEDVFYDEYPEHK